MDSSAQGNLSGGEPSENVGNKSIYQRNGGSPPESIWILGAGQFGYIAAQRLAGRYPKADLLVVDQRRQRLRKLQETVEVPVHQEDAIAFIRHHPLTDNQWIVPAVPLHVAWHWLKGMLGEAGTVRALEVPAEVDAQVPNPYRVPTGTLYASFATFRCPDACSEPEELCTHTRAPRLGNLFERLEAIRVQECHIEVVRSWQLAPGVGGYQGSRLKKAATHIQEDPGRWIVATSCRCHAVIDALSFQRSQ
ncbi:MAG TPA: hypothetical protein DCZ69_07550 [Syntrophobacteraceae bacterium]|nr:hypothetical protein [Syntrophobacteraceae bacterium]HBZ55665.1 hypothetical protein [Syntrophobacteraceae bacterium]